MIPPRERPLQRLNRQWKKDNADLLTGSPPDEITARLRCAGRQLKPEVLTALVADVMVNAGWGIEAKMRCDGILRKAASDAIGCLDAATVGEEEEPSEGLSAGDVKRGQAVLRVMVRGALREAKEAAEQGLEALERVAALEARVDALEKWHPTCT